MKQTAEENNIMTAVLEWSWFQITKSKKQEHP